MARINASWVNRLANLWRATKVRDEIHEELQYHLESRTRDNVAQGMPSNQAQEDALRRFGSSAVALEGSYEADGFVWMQTIVQDLRYGVRMLRRNAGFTFV